MKRTSIGMDNKLVLAVLFVTLSGLFVSTTFGIQNCSVVNGSMGSNNTSVTWPNTTCPNTTFPNTTTRHPTWRSPFQPNTTCSNMTCSNMTSSNMTSSNMTSSNMTSSSMTSSNTTSSNMTSSNTTSSNMTSLNMTSSNMSSSNMTQSNMTSSNVTSSNMTSSNMTSSNMTSSNMTSSNMTSSNMTSSNMTSSDMTSSNTPTPNTTMTPTRTTSTTVRPLTPNFTVGALTVPIDNTMCGDTQLCGSEPPDCSPATSDTCSFIGVQQLEGGDTFLFAIAGQPDDALGLVIATPGQNGDLAFFCVFVDDEFMFVTGVVLNNKVTIQELNANNVMATSGENGIQCQFAASVPPAPARTTAVMLSLASATFDSETGSVGGLTTLVQSPPVDITNPTATFANVAVNPNTTPSTTPSTTPNTPSTTTSNSSSTPSGSTTFKLSLMPVLLFGMIPLILTRP
ncbi:uncharacterized protein [Antennarius striatus]|uniref:uncharacterized protein n=1 Tax=Antennarius striatus TaxID=241820 RepID=UPI0035AE31D4